jgi:hypothetical protein
MTKKGQDKSKLLCRSKGKEKTHGICGFPKFRWLHLVDEDGATKCSDYFLKDEDVILAWWWCNGDVVLATSRQQRQKMFLMATIPCVLTR